MTGAPPRRVCPLCAFDDDITVFPVGEGSTWTYTCAGEAGNHPSYTWTGHVEEGLEGREGIAEEYGIYDDLLHCVGPGEPWLEHGIVEHRYKLMSPEVYFDVLLARWGHVAQGPRRYSVTVYLARTLGQLAREGALAWQYTTATGFFAYNGSISYWALLPAPPEDKRLSWADFATREGLDPKAWDLSRTDP